MKIPKTFTSKPAYFVYGIILTILFLWATKMLKVAEGFEESPEALEKELKGLLDEMAEAPEVQGLDDDSDKDEDDDEEVDSEDDDDDSDVESVGPSPMGM
jgi:Ran GTPase-activating protein (RanGAP) involved in mRNA processing and transport